MDLKLILVLLMGLISLGYAIPRVRRDVMVAVPIEGAMGNFAIESEESDEDVEGAEQHHGGYGGGGYGGGGYGGGGYGGGGYGGGGYGGGGYGGGGYGGGHGHGHHHHHGGYYG